MRVETRTSGRLAAAVTTVALVVSGGALPSLLTAATASAATAAASAGGVAAAVAGPQLGWEGSTVVGSAVKGSKSLAIASDGSEVAVWSDEPGQRKDPATVWAAVRRPNAEAWGPAVQLAATEAATSGIRLVAGDDGTVTALWGVSPKQPDLYGDPAARLFAATLSTAGGTWSKPAELVGFKDALSVWDIDLATGPGGSYTAVWSHRPRGSAKDAPFSVATATRAADGTWSAPQTITTPAEGGSAADSRVAVDHQGTVHIAFLQTGATAGAPTVVTVVSRTAGGDWGAPVPVAEGEHMERVTIAAGRGGALAVMWEQNDGGRFDDGTVRHMTTSVRPSPTAPWGPALKVPAGKLGNVVTNSQPLVGADGDVTLVWDEPVRWNSRDGEWANEAYTSTLPAGAQAWPAPQSLSGPTGHSWSHSAMGPDGTVRALWADLEAGKLFSSARTAADGTWSRANSVPGPGWDSAARIAAGPGGTASALAGPSAGKLLATRTTDAPDLALTASTVPTTAALAGTTATSKAWTPSWQVNRPAGQWSLTLADPAGRVVRTLTQATAASTFKPVWNGRTSAGTPAPNGPLTWTLKATAVRGPEAVTLASGTLTVTGGAAVHRDHGAKAGSPDGTGDLFQTTASGSLRIAYGNRATGNFSGSSTTTGWPKGFRPVPFGDTDGDRCNDTLVRLATGEMRLYTPVCGAALKPTTKHKVLGKGWNTYDLLTSPGDVNKDGRPDLLARDPKSGGLYLYTTTGKGILAPRVRLSTTAGEYKNIIGAGDLNGDGTGDLLLVNKSGDLLRSYGLGNGTFGPRATLVPKWAGSFNAVVVPGDLTGDGHADLVARDTAGTIWRWNGTAKATFTTQTRLATGWQVYNGIR
ncbi:FG-GAP-like repeat-containing protein [Streptomyces bambusae]|uniref:FG-GAP-like repeat-containing protein n=1 Tax=Streptomyces bambusae TaxID=1550616 RepID=UPI001CFC59DF|nr:FG-GAP-like repeat-containing protein [Streptomyces bambusae]MCB5164959.1 FG-GAP-like repeat-containing protein [Streptomyces bambusae]